MSFAIDVQLYTTHVLDVVLPPPQKSQKLDRNQFRMIQRMSSDAIKYRSIRRWLLRRVV